MNRLIGLLLRVVTALGLILLNTPLVFAQEFGVVEDLYVGRHTVSPFGGLGRYQNFLVQSEDQGTTWADATATAVTVSADLAAANPAPDGTTTADRLSQAASTVGAGRKQDVTLAAAAGNRTFTVSVWLKAAVAHTARLQIKTATNTQTAQNVSVEATWERFNTSYAVPAGDTNTTLTAVVYLDDGVTYNTLDVWGAQLEEIPSGAETAPGVYVKTVGSAVSTASRGLISNNDLLIAGGQTIAGNQTVSGNQTISGNLDVAGTIEAGSGNNVITTAAGLLDATKLTGDVPAGSLTNAVKLQASTPGTQQTGHLNISGTGIFGGNVNTSGVYQIGGSTVVHNPGTRNMFLGVGTGGALTTGTDNTFLGFGAGDADTTGLQNTFIGADAGGANVSGNSNTFLGYNAGLLNTNYNNTFIGTAAGDANTTGANNVFVGLDAGGANVIGSSNTFLGSKAGLVNTVAGNTFIGATAGDANTTGTNNVFVGRDAGGNNVSGNSNTFLGFDAGLVNTVGGNNTFLGSKAGLVNTAGDNTFIGAAAGDANTTGANNVFVGFNAGGANTTGASNTFLGNLAGESITTGSYNMFLGQSTDGNAATIASSIGIGYDTTVTANNQLVIGSADANGAITDAYIGSGVTKASPAAVTINATGGSGTDNAGAALYVAGGKGTGTGAGGSLIFQTAPAGGATGSSLNALQDRVTILSSGNVGVGTGTPAHKLHVSGALGLGADGGGTAGSLVVYDNDGTGPEAVTLNPPAGASLAASYTLTLPGDDGAANQVLKTDGSGVLSWVDQTADTDTNANTICSGTTTYLDGEGTCDDIAGVYANEGANSDLTSMSGLTGAISKPTTITVATTGGLRTDTGAGNTALLQAYDVDGTAYTTFATLTANNTPTLDLATSVTMGGNALYYATGTDVPITDGGTGAATAADARTNLGLAAGGAGDIWVEKAGDTLTGALTFNVAGTDITTVTDLDLTLDAASTGKLILADATINLSAGDTTLDLTGAATKTLTVLNSTTGQVANLDVEGSINLGAHNETLDTPAAGVLSVGGDLRVIGNDLQDSGGTARLTMATSSPQLTLTGDTLFSSNLISPYGGIGRFQNLLLCSEEFNDAVCWVRSAAGATSITASTITAPDGEVDAEAITFGSAGLESVKQDSNVTAASTQFTGSVWLKAASGTPTVRIGVIDEAATPAGTYANAALTTSWQRFSVSHTFAVGATGTANFILDDNTDTSGTLVVHAWGGQLESGVGSPGVYVKTGPLGTNPVSTASQGFVSGKDLLVGGSEMIGSLETTCSNTDLSFATGANGNLAVCGRLQAKGDGLTANSDVVVGSGSVLSGTAGLYVAPSFYTAPLTFYGARFNPQTAVAILPAGTDTIVGARFEPSYYSASFSGMTLVGAEFTTRLESGSTAGATTIKGVDVLAPASTYFSPSTAYGIHIRNQAAGITPTNVYGLAIDNITAGTNRYPIYQAGSTSQNNILAANTRIGSTTAPASGIELDVTGDIAASGRILAAAHAASQGLRLPTDGGAGAPAVVAGQQAGDIVVDTNDSKLYVTYDGAAWTEIGAGGGGAPTGAEYIVSAADATLTAEDVLTAGAGLTGTNAVGTFTLDVGDGVGIALAADSIAFAPAEVGSVTWLDNADRTWTFDIAAGGTNPTLAFSNNQIALGGNLDVTGTIEVGANNQVIDSPAAGVLSVGGDLRVVGNDIQDSGGTARVTMATSSPQLTLTGDTFLNNNLISPYGGIGRFQNVLIRSEEFNDAAWVKSASVTSTTDTIAAPDGQTTAEAITMGTAGLDSVKQDSNITAASTQFTGSIWLKAASGTPTVRIGVIDEAVTPAGTYANAALTTSWQRFQVSHTFAAGATGTANLILDDNTDTSATLVVHAWGGQLESGVGTAGVYAKTVASAIAASRGLVSNTDLLVAGAQTISGNQSVTGNLDVAGTIEAGSGNNVITTAAGLVDVAKLSVDLEEEAQLGTTNITGNAGTSREVLIATGTNAASWTAQHAGTNVAADLEEEGQLNLTAVTGNAALATAGQVIRATGDNTAAWGALDLADTDAVTGTLAVANGGTGASDAATARTNLGLAAGGAGDIWVEKTGDTMTGALTFNVAGTDITTVTDLDLTLDAASTGKLILADSTINLSAGDTTLDLTGAATKTLTVLNSTTGQVANLDVEGSINLGAQNETLDTPAAGVISTSGDLRVVGNDLQDSGGTARLTMATTSPQLTLSGDTFLPNYLISPYGGIGRFQNLLLRSEEFNDAAWVKSASTTSTTDTIVAPDGQTTAEALTMGTAGLDSVKQDSNKTAASTQFTGSAWLKAASGTPTVRIGVIDEAAIPAGTYANAALTTSWQRFSVSHTFAAGATGTANVILDDNTDTSGTLVVHAWGGQLESGVGSPGVYQKTSGMRMGQLRRGLAAAHAVDGDINRDGYCTIWDSKFVNDRWGSTQGSAAWETVYGVDELGNPIRGKDADLNGDGAVDISDITSMAGFIPNHPGGQVFIDHVAIGSGASSLGSVPANTLLDLTETVSSDTESSRTGIRLRPTFTLSDLGLGEPRTATFLNAAGRVNLNSVTDIVTIRSGVFTPIVAGPGTATALELLRVGATLLSSPVLTNRTGLLLLAPGTPGVGSGTNIGVDIADQGQANFSTVYGLRIQDITAGTTRYPIYQAGSTSQSNILAANTRIGSTTAPTNALSVTGNADISGTLTVGTLRLPNSATLPATCAVGDAYMDTDATAGQRFYLCQAANTWALQGDGGGGGGAPTGAEYIVSAADATLTAEDVLTAGAGLTGTNAVGTFTLDVGDGVGIALAADSIAFAPAEVGSVTWLDNADRTWTFDVAAAGTNPTLAFSNNQIALGGTLDVSGTIEVGANNQVIDSPAAGVISTSGDLRVVGNDLQDSGGTARLTMATASPQVTLTGDTFLPNYLISPFGGLGRFQNLLLRSEELNDAAWVKSAGAASSTDTIAAPDGATSAEAITFSGAGNDTVKQDSNVTAGTTQFTGSVWLKAASGTPTVRIGVIDEAATPVGTYTTLTLSTSWQRYQVNHNYGSGTAGTGTALLILDDNSQDNSVTNLVIHAWGAQLESGVGTAGVYAQTGATAVSTAGRGLVSDGDVRIAGVSNTTFQSVTAMTFGSGSALDLGAAALEVPNTTVASRPAAGTAGRIAVVTDGNSDADCTTGGGSTSNLCIDTGAAWVVAGDGGGGGGAPTGATYLVGSGDATLTAEQVLTDGTGVSLSLNTAPDPDTLTLALAPAEVGSVTWLDNADRTWTFDVAAAGTNPTLAFSNNQIALGGNLDVAGTIEAGSGNNVITTAAGLVDATKLTGLVPLASGGTTLSGALDDNVMVGNATTWESKALPSCSNGTTQKLLYNTTTNAFSCGTDQTSGGGATVKTGTVSIAEGSTADITFTTAFAGTPVVVANVQASGGEHNTIQVTAVSTTGATLSMEKIGGGVSSTYTVGWMASDGGNP